MAFPEMMHGWVSGGDVLENKQIGMSVSHTVGASVRHTQNLQVSPPRSRSRSPTCVSKFQVNSNKHLGPKKESLHNKRKVAFKQDEPHALPRQAG